MHDSLKTHFDSKWTRITCRRTCVTPPLNPQGRTLPWDHKHLCMPLLHLLGSFRTASGSSLSISRGFVGVVRTETTAGFEGGLRLSVESGLPMADVEVVALPWVGKVVWG